MRRLQQRPDGRDRRSRDGAPDARPSPPATRARSWAHLALALLLGAAIGCDALPWSSRDDVLVLTRRGDATGAAIARAFAARRDVPEERILELTLSTSPSERGIDAETYHREVAQPIERHLALADPDGDVRLLVTTRGLPLFVEDCATAPCRRASLDAALAQLGRTAEGRAFETRPNPIFGRPGALPADARSALRFLVARLDAPSAATDAPGDVPSILATALARPDPEPVEGAAPTDWWLATAERPEARSPAVSLLFEPVSRQLPHWGQRVCDACSRSGAPDARFGGVVIGGADAVGTPPEGLRLTDPGLVLSLAPTPFERNDGRGRARPGDFDVVLERWLLRGATAIGLHLGDPDVSKVARPGAMLLARVRGKTAVEAWFAGLPLLGGPHVFVGDPFRAVPRPEALESLEADPDGDGIASAEDNCPRHHNADQRDTNGDGFGNRCDGDVDDDGLVETSEGRIYPLDERGDLERVALSARRGPYTPDHDLDGDGDVDERDLVIVRLGLYRAPGY